MKIEIDKSDLLYAVSAVERAVSTKNTLPVLGGIMIKAQEGRLSFRATDLELAMECVVNAEIMEEGEAVVPGRKFSALSRLLPSGSITLSTVGELLHISYAGSRLSIPCFEAEEFPLLPQPQGEIEGRIPTPAFRKMVRQVAIGAAADEIRPVFTGVMTEFSAGQITMVATDTHRLTRCRGPWQGTAEGSLLIPVRSLLEVSRLAVNDEDDIIIHASNNQAFFSFGNLSFATRLIMGQYPDYHQVIPDSNVFITDVLVERSLLIHSLERAALISGAVSRGKGNLVRLEISEEGMFVAAESPDEGMIREPLTVTVSGESLTLNYNARYLLDVLKVIDEERVLLRMSGAYTPGLVLPESGEEEFLYLLLPVRVSRPS